MRRFSLLTLIATTLLLMGAVHTQVPKLNGSQSLPLNNDPVPRSGASLTAGGRLDSLRRSVDSSPIMFIENAGQFHNDAHFRAWGGPGTMWLAEDAIWITLLEPSRNNEPERPSLDRTSADREIEPRRGVNLKLSFPGANPHPHIQPFHRLDTVVSYFIRNDPGQWHPGVPVWAGVRYVDLYPGVDLELTSESGRWTWQLVFRKTNTQHLHVQLRVDGANILGVDNDRLRLATTVGNFTLPLLRTATRDGTLLELPVGWPKVNGTEITFPSSSILRPQLPIRLFADHPLPQDNRNDLLYSTFLGGSDEDRGFAIATDGIGNTYVVGETGSFDFPTTAGAFDTSYNGSGDAFDVFVIKTNIEGSGLVYATFLGGSDLDKGVAIAVDEVGNAYIAGLTWSSDFPTTTGTFDTSYNGSEDAFVAKLNTTGTELAYATFLGGASNDEAKAIAVDGSSSAYVTGWTLSSDFPSTAGAFDTSCGTDGNCNPYTYGVFDDAFVAKLSIDGTGLAYATFLGGSEREQAEAIDVDEVGNAYVAGWTRSSDFPTTTGAIDMGHNGNSDVFTIKINGEGTSLVYATFLGGSNSDAGFAIATGEAGSTYVVGNTISSDFPTTAEAFDTSYEGGDAFVAELNINATRLAYATFLGGSSTDGGYAITVDQTGEIYVVGRTSSADFPTSEGAFDTVYGGGGDTFVVKLDADSTGLVYGTFLGGSEWDQSAGILVNDVGDVYVGGETQSSNFPTTVGAFDTHHNGGTDTFMAKLAVGGVSGPTSTPSWTGTPTASTTPTPTPSLTSSLTVTNTPLPTSIPTDTAIPTSTPTTAPPTSTPTPTADPYEPDDTCANAVPILPDGDPQVHNTHTAGDADWLRVQTTAGTDYVISVLAIGENAHPVVRLYAQCDQAPFRDSSGTFGIDQFITFQAERDGLYYIEIRHLAPDAFGNDTAYQVSIRPATTGAAIIAGGRQYPGDQFQEQITFMTDHAYQVFQKAGYDHDDIFYMSADPDQPPHMRAPSVPANLRYALQTWAPQQIQDGDPLFLYLADHGENDFFFLDTGTHKVTPDDLDAWLLAFEAQRPNSPVVIIIEACRAGSFITPLGTISKSGRVIVTATGASTDAYVKPPGQGGGYFSDTFFNALSQNYDLWQSYQIARKTVQEARRSRPIVQRPWIDGNGNGLPYPHDPDDEGAGRSLGLGGVAGLSGQAPFIEQPTLPQPNEDEPTLIQVKVLDENPEGLTVWMEVTKPSTPPASAPPGYITPISHAERIDLTYNPTAGKFETRFAFDEAGRYQFVFNAEDAGGQRAQSVIVTTTTGGAVYLPLVAR